MHRNLIPRHESEGTGQGRLSQVGPSDEKHQGNKELATDPEFQRQRHIEMAD